MSGAVHTIAVDMILREQVRHALRGMITDFRGLTREVVAANEALSTLATIGRWTAGAAFLGGGALLGMEKMAKAGWEMVKVQKDMAMAGATNLEIQEATAEAWKLTSQYGNMGATDLMKMFKDARQVFAREGHSFGDVIKEMDPFARAGAFLKAYDGGKHKEGAGLAGELFKAMASAEFAGKIDPKIASEHVAQLVGMKVAFGHGMSIGKFFQTQGAAGQSLRNADDDFLYGMLPAISQVMPGTGPALMTAFQRIGAGTMWRNKSAKFASDIGLIEKGGIDKKGALIDPSKIKGWELFHHNPARWVHDVLKPLLDAKWEPGSPQQIQALSRIFPDRNAAKIIGEFLNPQMWSKLVKDAENVKLAAQNYQKHWKEYLDGNFDYQMQRFSTQWHNLTTGLGMESVGPWVSMLRGVNDGLSSIAQTVQAHPGIGSAIATTLYGLAGGFSALAAVGIVALLSPLLAALGPGGWFIVGLGALAGVLMKLRPWIESKNHEHDWETGHHRSHGWNWATRWNNPAWSASKDVHDEFMNWGSLDSLGTVHGALFGKEAGGAGLKTKFPEGAFNAVSGQVAERLNAGILNIGERVDAMPLVNQLGYKLSNATKSVADAVSTSTFVATLSAKINAALSSIAASVSGAFGGGGGGGAGGGGMKAIPQSFNPSPPRGGGGGGVQHVYLDGEAVGRVMEPRLVARHEFPGQAPYHDGSAGWTAPDAGTITV